MQTTSMDADEEIPDEIEIEAVNLNNEFENIHVTQDKDTLGEAVIRVTTTEQLDIPMTDSTDRITIPRESEKLDKNQNQPRVSDVPEEPGMMHPVIVEQQHSLQSSKSLGSLTNFKVDGRVKHNAKKSEQDFNKAYNKLTKEILQENGARKLLLGHNRGTSQKSSMGGKSSYSTNKSSFKNRVEEYKEKKKRQQQEYQDIKLKKEMSNCTFKPNTS